MHIIFLKSYKKCTKASVSLNSIFCEPSDMSLYFDSCVPRNLSVTVTLNCCRSSTYWVSFGRHALHRDLPIWESYPTHTFTLCPDTKSGHNILTTEYFLSLTFALCRSISCYQDHIISKDWMEIVILKVAFMLSMLIVFQPMFIMRIHRPQRNIPPMSKGSNN